MSGRPDATEKGRRLSYREEDVLEAILNLEKLKGEARVSELANRLELAAPTVTEIVARLSKKGFVDHQKYGRVKLTSEGRRKAESIARRHEVLTEMLVRVLKVPREVAEGDACYMEHGLSEITLSRIVGLLRFLETCVSESVPDFEEQLAHFLETGKCRRGGGKGPAGR